MMAAPQMLATLSHLAPFEAEAAVCRALDSLLPNIEDVRLGEVEHRVLAEARLQAVEGDIATVLSDILLEMSLGDRDEEVRQRLGNSGLLPWGLFSIEFVRWDDVTWFGVTKDEVTAALENPDLFEHMVAPIPADSPPADTVGLSVAAKRSALPGGADPHWLLIFMSRVGSRLRVSSAWRVFDEVVRSYPYRVKTVRDLAQAFLNRHGLDVALEGVDKRSNLLWDEPVAHGERESLYTFPKEPKVFGSAAQYAIALGASYGNVNIPSSQRVLVFAVNRKTYSHYLRMNRAPTLPR
jgi:hypothetical protein